MLPLLSKIREKHVYSLLIEYPSSNQPLLDSQWGFQVHRSTSTALITPTRDWFESLEDDKEVRVVFLDLKKLLTLWHIIIVLMNKLKLLGIPTLPLLLHWLFSYLHRRFQRVVVDGKNFIMC